MRSSTGTSARACSPPSARCADAGTTVVIEDVAFPVARLAAATLDLQALLRAHGYRERDHLRPRARRQPALRLHAGLQLGGGSRAATRRFMDAVCRPRRRASTTARSRPSTAPGATWRPFVELEWGREAYALMHRIKTLFDPQNLLNPGVVLNADPRGAPQEPEAAAGRPTRSSTSASSAASASRSARRARSRCRRASASPAGARSRACERLPDDGAATIAALRELYDYHGIDTCAGLRPLRDGVPGRHRDRHADQGAARAARGADRGARRRRASPLISAP